MDTQAINLKLDTDMTPNDSVESQHGNTRTMILGAGLAGLSAGLHLTSGYDLYEKEARAGGCAKSIYTEGFAFDHGPHILYSVDPYATQLIKRLLNDNFHAQGREAWIYHASTDVFTKFPFQANLHGLPVSIVKECIMGVMEAIRKKEQGDAQAPKNYEEWIYQTFGEGIAKHLMIPYSEKIWTISPKLMNYEWIGRRVPTPSLDQILEGALKDSSQLVGFNNEFWYPLDDGIEALPKSFLPHVAKPKTQMRATRISHKKKVVEFSDGSRQNYDFLISTLALPTVVKLIEDAPSYVVQAADELEYNSILCVNFGVNREKITNQHWLYFYEPDFYGHRVSFPMNLSPNTTPKGKSSVTCEVAYSKHRKLNRENAVERVVEDLIKTGIMNPDDTVCAENVKGITPAYIIYDLNHKKNTTIIREWLQEQDIYSCGRFGEWEYYNMDHSIMSGKRAAEWVNARVAANNEWAS